ncbi:nuclear transport factor 2 family protein [Gallaecimonas kandeliae]|uniref:nuclear transport factor 2 family protein n=1 Tax=Gallaecimonas kandeliae TaxID=3029055 RepID=UPI002647AAD6|nr:nuclear transport factor 2 family protein [Gallaecimonas kandeliae]WKE63944.1 nuclear transport factor 2 family protein [Gallaecimonas kandeliae]
MQAALERFLGHYQRLDKESLHLLAEMYSSDLVFEDPAHRITGLPALERYFEGLYQQVEDIHFDFHAVRLFGEEAWVQWTLKLRHPRLSGGRSFSLDGVSLLSFDSDGKVCQHRDYFDLGAMLYERLPLLGPLVRWLKGRLAP